MSKSQRIVTVVVAAGSGSRFGGDMPKQFRLLAGRPLLMHTVQAFERALPGQEIVLVLSPDTRDLWLSLCDSYGCRSPRIVAGGKTRWESVKNAVSTVTDADIILVHDGARPLVDADTIHRVVDTAAAHGACVPVVPVTDSLRRADTGLAVDRTPFRAVQTPQGFDAGLLRRAYAAPYQDWFTDDASVVEHAGHPIAMTDGSPANIKVTYPQDIRFAESLLQG